MPLEIVPVAVLRDNYVWLVHDADSAETVAVDPSVADPVLEEAARRGWRITQVWNTHWHPDHPGGNDAIRAATGCAITGPAEAEKVSRMDRIVAGGDRARIGDRRIDRHRLRGITIVDEPDVIVAEHRDGMDLEHGGAITRFARAAPARRAPASRPAPRRAAPAPGARPAPPTSA